MSIGVKIYDVASFKEDVRNVRISLTDLGEITANYNKLEEENKALQRRVNELMMSSHPAGGFAELQNAADRDDVSDLVPPLDRLLSFEEMSWYWDGKQPKTPLFILEQIRQIHARIDELAAEIKKVAQANHSRIVNE